MESKQSQQQEVYSNKFEQFLKNKLRYHPNQYDILDNTYQLIKPLGNGAYGIAYLVKCIKAKEGLKGRKIEKDKQYVIKFNHIKQYSPERSMKSIREEANIWQQCDGHDNILKLYEYSEKGVLYSPDGKQREVKSPIVYFVSEFAENGALFNYLVRVITKENPEEGDMEWTEKTAKWAFFQLILGLDHMHNKTKSQDKDIPGYCHGDIKPDNILVDKDFCIKICDFGGTSEKAKDGMLKGQRGTKFFMAPELAKNYNKRRFVYNGEKIDVFSTAVTLYQFMCLHYPFRGDEFSKTPRPCKRYKQIQKGEWENFWKMTEKLKNFKKFNSNLSEDFKEVIQMMMQYDPEKRATIESILKSPYIQQMDKLDQQKIEFPIEKLVVNNLKRYKTQEESIFRTRSGTFEETLNKNGIDFLKKNLQAIKSQKKAKDFFPNNFNQQVLQIQAEPDMLNEIFVNLLYYFYCHNFTHGEDITILNDDYQFVLALTPEHSTVVLCQIYQDLKEGQFHVEFSKVAGDMIQYEKFMKTFLKELETIFKQEFLNLLEYISK